MSIKQKRPHCDECGKELVRLSEDDESGEPHGFPWRVAHAHVCTECFDGLHDAAWENRDPCGECETKPCERGSDCWFQPNIGYPYETYVADAVGSQTKDDQAQQQLDASEHWIKTHNGDFGDDYADMCDMMNSLGGWPDVDRWGASSIREWWHETDDGREMLIVLEKLGMKESAIIHPTLATPDEIRASISYRSFIKVVEERCFHRSNHQ